MPCELFELFCLKKSLLLLSHKEHNNPKHEDSAHALFYPGFLLLALVEGTDRHKPPLLHPSFQFSNSMQTYLDLTILHLKRFVS